MKDRSEQLGKSLRLPVVRSQAKGARAVVDAVVGGVLPDIHGSLNVVLGGMPVTLHTPCDVM